MNDLAAGLLKGDVSGGRPGDLATGLLKGLSGLSGLLPGLDAAKLLQQQQQQQQQNSTADSPSAGKSSLLHEASVFLVICH